MNKKQARVIPYKSTKKNIDNKSIKVKKNTSSVKEKNQESNIKAVGNNKIKAKKNKENNLKKFVSLLVIAAVIYCVYYLLTSTRFQIKNINVNGNKKYSTQQIIDSSYIKLNKNIFLLRTSKKVKAIEDLPFIKSVKVSRRLPDTINIDVIERKSEYLAYDKDSNKYYKLDSDGVILESINIDQKRNDELLTYGIMFDDNVVLGSKINDADISKLRIYQEIYEQIKKSNINLPITKLNFENSLTTILLNDKLSVIFPNDTNLEYNVNFLSNIIKNIGADSTGVIDMTKSNPTFSNVQD